MILTPELFRLVATALTLGLVSSPTFGQTALEPGSKFEATDVLRQVNARDDGKQVTMALEIEVTDARGRTRKRTARAFRRYTDSAKQSLIRYESPASVRGTSFLTWDQNIGEDSQWLYLPDLRRVRRISTRDRGSSFLGTDFTYENIKTELKVALDDYEWLPWGWQSIDGCNNCLVVEGRTKTPALSKELGHTTQRVWIDPSRFIVARIEYYDETTRLKTVHARDIRKIQGIWTPHEMVCENHQTGGTSTFRFSDHDYSTELSDTLFSQDALRR
jgi:outer membrane lipoprotein-sorting protein